MTLFYFFKIFKFKSLSCSSDASRGAPINRSWAFWVNGNKVISLIFSSLANNKLFPNIVINKHKANYTKKYSYISYFLVI